MDATAGQPTGRISAGDARAQKLQARVVTNAERAADLKEQLADIAARMSTAPEADRPLLVAQQQLVQAQLDQAAALGDSLSKAVALFSSTDESTDGESLNGRISALQKAVPDLTITHQAADAKKQPVATASSVDSSGLFTRAATLFSLLRYQHSIDTMVTKTGLLLAQTNALSQPLVTRLHDVMKPADDNQQVATQISDVGQLKDLREKLDANTDQFRILSAALLPLREQSMALEHCRGNLTEWKTSIVAQSDLILRTLVTRAVGLAAVLFILILISEGWRRATFKYVHDARRRRQFLLFRRFATTALMAVVLVMGFVSDFSSLATFAGFITAGIAVALQTIILSVAAYFFLIGRYGVRVGDRVTVSGVTGEVIDIGLVRVFLMELAGTSVDLFPTGRVVVLANSALFSSSPLYKQLPGTDYAWHEMYVSMSGSANPAKAQKALLDAVNKVYGGYRQVIERQHGALERLLDYKTDPPVPTSHVRLTDTGLEIVIRFPAEIRKMSQIDEAVATEVLAAIHGDEELGKSI
ncbi:MAG TPA: mechanosensitive ion channel domain-containing protein, partial [Opitutaceae bacterium]|nr:mechanosensitive ion channel domain-containing protein [Opitutaceae bacterium]